LIYFTEAVLVRQLGASCAVVPSTSSGQRRLRRPKATGLKVGQISPPGVLRRSPDGVRIALHAAPARTNRFFPMKWAYIYDCWYQANAWAALLLVKA
jgi:hypothetical protein